MVPKLNAVDHVQRGEAPPCQLPFVRGLNRAQAASYIGVSPSLFDKLVADGRMPPPKRINSRTVWDRWTIDKAFDLLPGGTLSSEDEWEFAV